MYLFSEEVQKEIDQKTDEICTHTKTDDRVKLLNDFEKFHSVSRLHDDVVRYFVKRREVKLLQRLIELNTTMPLRGALDEKAWDYLHLMYLLYENGHSEAKPDIQACLLKRFEDEKKPSTDDMLKSLLGSDGLGSILNTLTGAGGLENMMKGLTEKMGELGKDEELGALMKNIDPSNPEKMMEDIIKSMGGTGDVPKSSPALINDLIEDIAGNLKESGSDISKLMESTKNMGLKYQEKIKKGEMKVEDMMGSLMGVLNDPSKLMESMKTMDVKSLPDPEKLLSGLLGGVDTNGIMNQILGGFEGKASNEGDGSPLTETQIKELEEFYSSLNLK
jgi:hypothetical protein